MKGSWVSFCVQYAAQGPDLFHSHFRNCALLHGPAVTRRSHRIVLSVLYISNYRLTSMPSMNGMQDLAEILSNPTQTVGSSVATGRREDICDFQPVGKAPHCISFWNRGNGVLGMSHSRSYRSPPPATNANKQSAIEQELMEDTLSASRLQLRQLIDDIDVARCSLQSPFKDTCESLRVSLQSMQDANEAVDGDRKEFMGNPHDPDITMKGLARSYLDRHAIESLCETMNWPLGLSGSGDECAVSSVTYDRVRDTVRSALHAITCGVLDSLRIGHGIEGESIREADIDSLPIQTAVFGLASGLSYSTFLDMFRTALTNAQLTCTVPAHAVQDSSRRSRSCYLWRVRIIGQRCKRGIPSCRDVPLV